MLIFHHISSKRPIKVCFMFYYCAHCSFLGSCQSFLGVSAQLAECVMTAASICWLKMRAQIGLHADLCYVIGSNSRRRTSRVAYLSA